MSAPKTATSVRLSTAQGLQAKEGGGKGWSLPQQVKPHSKHTGLPPVPAPRLHSQVTRSMAAQLWRKSHPRLYSCWAGTNATSHGTRNAVTAAAVVATALQAK